MPSFRFNKSFGVGRGIKVFLNLEGSATRGVLPGVEQPKKQVENLEGYANRGVVPVIEQPKKQAENLKNVRQWIIEQKETLEAKNREIFRLQNELRAAKEQADDSPDRRSALRMIGESETTGALPDFLIIGAPKGGTNSLYQLLTRHPHVEGAALKGLQYFNKHFDKGTEWYRLQFSPPRWKDGRRSLTGEATPRYLYHPLVPERVAKVVPQARLIALLRNPVDRTYSHYHERVGDMRETRGFEEALRAEEGWSPGKEAQALEHGSGSGLNRPPFPYLKMGIYVDQLLRWSKYFRQDQILVLDSENFFKRELDTLELVLNFLDLPDWAPEQSPKIHNKGRYKQQMDPGTRQWLEDYFRPHNQRLYEYLGVDFGW